MEVKHCSLISLLFKCCRNCNYHNQKRKKNSLFFLLMKLSHHSTILREAPFFGDHLSFDLEKRERPF